LAQLGNRFQHALRAYTPTDQKAVRAAAQSFRANANVDVAKEIQELNVGEALVSTLDAKGAPTPVARTKIRAPNSQVGPILPAQREALMKANTAGRVYEKAVDRVSAHEILGKRAAQLADAEAKEEERAARDKEAAKPSRSRSTGSVPRSRSTRSTGSSRTTPLERQGGRVASGVFNTIVRELMRGILGTPSRRRR
jgi:hypothetical protein